MIGLKTEGGRLKVRRMLNAQRFVGVLLVALVVSAAIATTAWAVPEVRRVDTQNVTEFKEPAALNKSEQGGESEKMESHSEKEKSVAEGEAAETGEKGEEEHEPWWMFPGWQTVFALLAVGYCVLTVKFLPMIMAKEEGQN
jgi:hypothetical protein